MTIPEAIEVYSLRKYEENDKFIDILLDVRTEDNKDVVDRHLAVFSLYSDDKIINAARIRKVLTEILEHQEVGDNGIVQEGTDSLVGVGSESSG